jgi:PKD repeat protein
MASQGGAHRGPQGGGQVQGSGRPAAKVGIRSRALVLALSALLLTALAPMGAVAVDPPVATVVPYEATGYRHDVVSQGQGTGFEQPGYDDSGFAVGAAAFGTAGGCANDEAITTSWPSLTDILVRRTIALPDDGRQVHIGMSMVGAVHVFMNGTDISGGLVSGASFCPRREDLHFVVPEDALVRGGDNLLAIRGRAGTDAPFLDLTVMLAPAPANDDFAGASSIGSLPFSDETSAMAASMESGEPAQSCVGGVETDCQSIWYLFTPAASGPYLFDAFTGPANDMPSPAGLAVYTGAGLGDLSTVAARQPSDWRPILFSGEAGTTYALQVLGHLPLDYSGPSLTVSIAAAPDPTVSFEVPADPISTADELSLFPFVDDPAVQPVASYAWDLGDGTTSSEEVVRHYYTAAGTYQISLLATMADGRTGSDQHSVTVTEFEGPDPIAGFDWSPAEPTTATEILFSSTSTDPALVGIGTWAWTFDGGGTGSGVQVSHTFTTPGDHVVGLVVTTLDGRTSSIEQTVAVTQHVLPDPVAGFSFWPPEPFAGQTVQFFDGSSDPGFVGIAAWAWDFGDGGTATDPNPTHVFASVGTYTVGLTVTTVDGRSASTSQSVTIAEAPPPSVAFGWYPQDPSRHDTLSFWDASFDPVGIGIASWRWSFGDGDTSRDQFPTHHYGRDGDFTVRLTVVMSDGRRASMSQTVAVRTHDVAVTRIVTATSVDRGQTKDVAVDLVSRRSTESVTLTLFRSTTTGFEVIEQRVVSVATARETRVVFRYRYSSADAQLGWVSFRVGASIDGLRDALPGDNEAISAPVKVDR